MIDLEDLDKVKKYSWRFQNNMIYTNLARNKPCGLNRYVLDIDIEKDKRHVFFKNHNSLDYRKINLYCGNNYILIDDVYKVLCYSGDYFLIDKQDKDLVSGYIWHIDKNGYAITKDKATHKVIKLHRLLLGINNESSIVEVDHINRNKIDNRRSNLRIANRSQNCINRDVSKNNKSGKVGVYQIKESGKWIAQITNNNVRHYLGCFDNIEDAIQARKNAEIKYHKDFSSKL